ncbi:hypothetical protein [Lysinibacillus sp. LZ02]|uniref:hypothetical protein n=1 Tax=Lysinibacillus sp. LZ02 TaxID=3420668 RepID=UPI003D36AB27
MANKNTEAKVTFKVFNEDFNRAMKEMDNASSRTRKELQLAQEQLKENGTESEKLTAKMDSLKKQHEIASEKVRLTADQLDKAKQIFGENSEEVAKLESKLLSLQISEQKYANQLSTTKQELTQYEKASNDLKNTLALTESSLDDFANVLGDDLVKALNDGTANSKQIEQAIEKIGQSALGVDGNMTKLRNALRQLDDGNSLEEVRQELSRLGQEAIEVEKDVGGLKEAIAGIGGTIASGIGIATAVNQALEISSLNTKIAITFDVPEESMAAVREATKRIQAYGLDGEEALEAVRRQWALNADATDEANTRIVEGAGVIASAYNGIDLIELVQETNEVAAALEIMNDEALALTNVLLKAGFPPEQLDIISEYGTQMKEAGFNAAEIQAIFEKGIDTKTWNIDNLMDGVKEVRLQMASFGSEVPKALKPALKEAGLSAEQFQKWGAAVASGGKEGSQALSDMVTWLDSIEDATLKNEISTAAFGTKWEDQGQNMTAVFQGLNDVQDKTRQNQDELNTAIDQMNNDPTVQFRQALTDIQTNLAPVLIEISNVIGAVSSWTKENSTFATTVVTVVAVIGTIIGILTALAPVVTAATTAAGALGISIGAIAAPVGIAIAAITAVIAIGVALYKNWDEIKEKAGELKDGISTKFSEAKEAVSTKVTEMKTDAINKVNQMKEDAINKFTEVKTGISNKIGEAKTSVVNTVEEMKTGAVNKIVSLKDAATNKFTEVKTGISNKIGEAKTSVVNTVEEMKTGALNKISSLKDAAATKFNETKESMLRPIREAKTSVSNVIDDIKGFFSNLSLKIPDIKLPKLPKFKLTGEFSLNPPSVPKLSVTWNAKGAIFTKPTVFNSPNYGLQGFGEAGPEAAIPLTDSVLGTIGAMIAQTMPSSQSVIQIAPAPIYLDGREIAKVTFNHTSNLQHNSVALKAFSKGVNL